MKSPFFIFCLVALMFAVVSVSVAKMGQSSEPKVEVLAFTATWCGACRRDHSQLEEICKCGVNVTEVDFDKHPRLVQKYRIHRLPVYVILQDGTETHRTDDIDLLVSMLVKVICDGDFTDSSIHSL